MTLGQGDKARVLILSDDGKYPKRTGNSFRGVWLQTAAPAATANVSLRSGDIVFQDSSPHSGQAALVKIIGE